MEEEKKECKDYGVELDKSTVQYQDSERQAETEQNKETALQPVQIAGVKISQKTFKTAGIILLVLIIAVIGGRQISSNTAQKRGEKYVESLQDTALTMLQGAGDAEDCGNLIYKVWRNAIYEENDTETDIYTKKNGMFVSDFNDALNSLFYTPSFEKKISGIKENQSTVKSMMKDMKNPPEEYEDAYDALSELYDAYLEFTNLVIDPNGSLRTYSDDFTDADNRAAKCFNTVEMYFED